MGGTKTAEPRQLGRYPYLIGILTIGVKSKPQIIHTMEALRNYGRISQNLWRKLDKLRQYHNLALHDPAMTVSQEMCDCAREALAELEEKKK